MHRDDAIRTGCLLCTVGMYGQKETDLELGGQWMRVAAELGTTPHLPIYRAPRAAQHFQMKTMHDCELPTHYLCRFDTRISGGVKTVPVQFAARPEIFLAFACCAATARLGQCKPCMTENYL